jgi:signal transduction histidine kinase/HPt (histidine-containing phosphotransfer) domain-containing protein/ActR/RegA family two-component response regulator
MIYFAGEIHQQIAGWKKVIRLLCPILLPLLALTIQELFWDHIHSQKFLFFYPAIMVSGWIAGKRGAMFATFFSSGYVFYFLMESYRLTPTLSHDEYIPLIVFIAIGLLITHYLRVEERILTQLAVQSAELEEANQARLTFLAQVSHEIRTPLNAILGYAQLLETELKSERQLAMTGRIQQAGDHLLSMLNKILDFKKIEAQLLKLDPQPEVLGDIIDAVGQTVESIAQSKGISFYLECDSTIQALSVSVDRLRLTQILLNLCTNGIKFTAYGSVTLRVQVVSDSGLEVMIRFEVQDTGMGIAQESISQLFKPFMQADSSIAGRFGGSGLGLSIVKQLVELMGGAVGVESQIDEGSLFWFVLPAKRVTTSQSRPTDTNASTSQGLQRLSGLNVLAADDNPLNLDVLSRIVTRQGGCVECVSDGQAALLAIEKNPRAYHVILMDLHMPGLDGIEATRLIRCHYPEWEIPILAYSAEALELTPAKDAIKLFDGWIEKPLQLEFVIEKLAKYCPVAPDVPSMNAGGDETAFIIPAHDQAAHPDDLPTVVDRLRVESVFGRDVDTFWACFQQFQRVLVSIETELNAVCKRKDLHQLRELLHNLRGSAANLGLASLAAEASKVEREFAAETSWGTEGPCLDALIIALHDALNVSLRPAHPPTSSRSVQETQISELELARFYELLMSRDLEALTTYTMLAATFRHELDEASWSCLNDAMQRLDFESAIAVLFSYPPPHSMATVNDNDAR